MIYLEIVINRGDKMSQIGKDIAKFCFIVEAITFILITLWHIVLLILYGWLYSFASYVEVLVKNHLQSKMAILKLFVDWISIFTTKYIPLKETGAYIINYKITLVGFLLTMFFFISNYIRNKRGN